MLTRLGLMALGGGVVVALVIGGIMAITPDDSASADSLSSATGGGVPAPDGSGASAPPALRPLIAEGRRDLGDGIYAERAGTSVTVHFDTDSLRTRFDWKFEGVVRATLPLVYGTDVRQALDSIAPGTWARGDLVASLPTRGIPLELTTGRLRIWPITRPGRDGPLVVAYRVDIEGS